MRKAIIGLIVLVLILIASNVYAGCVDIGTATSWSCVDTHTIIIYRGSSAIALLKIPYCFIYSSSDIRPIKDYICSWDKIIIDGEVCDITKVERL